VPQDLIENSKLSYSNFAQSPFRPGQREAIDFIYNSPKKIVVVVAPTGCLAADTVIRYNRARLGRKMTIENLYLNTNGLRKGRGSRGWKRDIPTYVRSYNGKTIQLHKATDFIQSGLRPVWLLELEDGKTLKATPDHMILTQAGWKQLQHLVPLVDYVLCDSPRAKVTTGKLFKKNDLNLAWIPNHPFARKIKSNKSKHGFYKSIEMHRAIYEAHINKITLEEYINILRERSQRWKSLRFINPKKYHIHHIDGNHNNNSVDNLEALGARKHKRLHAHPLNFGQGIPVPVRVRSIYPCGVANTYDITTPDHQNFIANDMVVHNSGKSVLGMVAGNLYPRFCYLVSSKQLQNQIALDFPESTLMKGRSNYLCSRFANITCADCSHSDSSQCSFKHNGCQYERAKHRCLKSNRQILNYHYFITEANYIGNFSDYPFVVCDEGDVVEQVLSGIVSLHISVKRIHELGLRMPKYKSFTATHAIKDWQNWCREADRALNNQIAIFSDRIINMNTGTPEYFTASKALRFYTSMQSNVSLFSQSLDDTWVVDLKSNNNIPISYSLKPSWLNKQLVEKYFWRHGDKFLLMSATFPTKDVLAELLGLYSADIDIIEMPSTFPVENRKVLLCYTANLKSNGKDGIDPNEMSNILKKVQQLLGKHPHEKGIIHTVNWKINDAIMSIGDDRLITHDALNKHDQLSRFMSSDRPLVFVSPSSARGIDLKDDLGRFSIIVKAPYPNLADKLVSTRLYSKSGVGANWYASITAQEIVQMAGRCVRHDQDYATTYILDTLACNMIAQRSYLFPRYFIEACDVE